MVSNDVHRNNEPPRKRVKMENHKKSTRKFTSVDEIRAGLRNQNQDGLIETLTTLRNQLSIRSNEETIPPQDERLLLAQHWLENVPGAHDIFGIWDAALQRQTSLLSLIVSILSSLLTLVSSHYTHHSLGQAIIKTLLTPPYMRRLNSYIGGSHSELILVTLKLFNGISAFAGGQERKSVLESFGWETKSTSKLLNMRRKIKHDESIDPLARPDIRTLYILFILSFVGFDSHTQVKQAYLEQHRDAFLSIFKGLIQDSYFVARKVLEVCWGGIWSDPKVKRTIKIGLFNETTVAHIAKLYDRAEAEDDDPDHIPADLVHHFLLAICTRPGTGICFKDRGWYPRETETDDQNHADGDATQQKGGKIYNKILANVLRTLKVNEDLRQQELALKIISACPELVAGYWAGVALTLEPRLSSKWITNISIFGSIISLPIPSSTFQIPNSALYQPTPPPLSNIMENILPSVNTRAHLSKGLQSPSGLVQHCTALALAKCLNKYEQVMSLFRHIETTLGENEMDGQWCKRRRDVERETRRRVPEFQVIVAFAQQRFGEGVAVPGGVTGPPNATRAALLSESAQRLLWMYHRCLPLVVAEARFDVGKLLQYFSSEPAKVADDGDVRDEPLSEASRLHMVRQLHVLRLLKESDQFDWSAKTGSLSSTYLSILLKAYTTSENPATQSALADLLDHILTESIMFQEDPDEAHLWLISLPTTKRAPGAESPDGAPLTDEADSVIAFLDDCVQRCMKTPYRYMEELYSLSNAGGPSSTQGSIDRLDVYPSPLLMTLLEQLDVKVGKKSLTPSDVLALASFVRKLVFRLTSKQQDLHFLGAVAGKLDGILAIDRLFPQYPIITAAIRRELTLLRACLLESVGLPTMTGGSSTVVDSFLTQVEQLPVPESKNARTLAAYEFIDWLRLVDQPIGSTELRRLFVILEKYQSPALYAVAEYLEPTQGSLWNGMDIVSRFNARQPELQFDFLLLHASESEIPNLTCRDILTKSVFGTAPTLASLKRYICFIAHRLSASQGNDNLTRGLLMLLASILEPSLNMLSPADSYSLKDNIFVRSEVFKSLLVSESLSDAVREGIVKLVQVSIDPTNTSDRFMIADISAYWRDKLVMSIETTPGQAKTISTWIPCFQSTDLYNILDIVSSSTTTHNSVALELLEATLSALQLSIKSEPAAELTLKARLPQLLNLRSFLFESSILEDMIAKAVGASLPAYCSGDRLYGNAFEETNIGPIIARSDLRWSRHLDPLPKELPLQSFLAQETWSSSTVNILTGLLYGRSVSKAMFVTWLESDHCATRSIEYFIAVLHAFLDTCSLHDAEALSPDKQIWARLCSRLAQAVVDENISQDTRSLGGRCISLMLALMSSKITELVVSICEVVQKLPVTSLTTEVLIIGRRLHNLSPSDAGPLLALLASHGMQWAVRRFADDDDTSSDMTINELVNLVQKSSDIKPHLVETLLSVTIQSRLSNVAALKLVTILSSNIQIKPAIINRHLQSIIQHPYFFKHCANPGSLRDAIVNLLHVLFNLHPVNTCQVTHVEPLVKIYRGTLSIADGQILSIFHLFETQRKASIASLLSRWSSSPNFPSTTSLDAVRSLDSILVLRTCLYFPGWRRLNDPLTTHATSHDAQLYDPVFLMLLFAQVLAENPPDSAFGWVELFRTNVVSLLIKAMSSKDGGIRNVALYQIAGLWQYLSIADMQEKPHVLHLLSLLKDVFPPPSDDPPKRLPSFTTLILLHALRGIFYPSNFIYPITARFLLQRPELDITDVPMLYNMLYSSSSNWKKERGWIIRFISDGMMSTEDWRVLKRRHTWDLLASLFQSSEDDRVLRNSVFEVLANLTCNAQATTSLVLKSGLLAWIEMQIICSKKVNGIEWAKILNNIMAVASSDKLELSTNGQWRAIICRCFMILLDSDRNDASDIVVFATAAILRLSLLPGPPLSELPNLLHHAVSCMMRLEANIVIPSSSPRRSTQKIPCPPFRAHEIHELYPFDDPLGVWGETVETLWRVTMTLQNKPLAWDKMTNRLLIWRAIVGSDDSLIGEWARMQVVANLAG